MDSTETAGTSAAATVTSGFLGGRLQLVQPARGYRAGMDAALLAAACDALPGQRVIEAGCGAGAALLSAAMRRPQVSFTGVERDLDALALAQVNIAAKGLTERVHAISGDVERRFSSLALPAFDAAFSNPPFFDDPEAIRGPAPEREGAWMADGGLKAWTRFLLKAVREGGTITVIHRADRLGDLLGLLGNGAGSFKVRPVHPYADKPAKRVLVRCVKTGKAPLVLLPPLVMHDHEGGKHTVEAEAVLRGEAEIGWS